mmetsp:Transcript_8281/g.35124  ORF Transcript_8281/g.35124 Transcript_8281/m.35124 type:complete len:228 (-) Transcript_8281:4608-5291(-)
MVLQVQKRLFALEANLREHAFEIRAERAVVVAQGHLRREKLHVVRVRHQRGGGPASDARRARQKQVSAGLTQDAVEARDAVQNLGEEQNVQLLHLALVRDELGLDVLLKRVCGHGAHHALVVLAGAGPRGEHHVRGARRVDAPVLAEDVAEDGVELRTCLGANQSVSEHARGFVPKRLHEIHRQKVVPTYGLDPLRDRARRELVVAVVVGAERARDGVVHVQHGLCQ